MVRESLPNNQDGPSRIGVVMVLSNMQLPLGGTQKQALCLANELQSQGVSVCIVSRRHTTFKITRGGYGRGLPSEETNGKVNFIRLPILRLQPAWSFLVSFLFWAAINRKRFQIIHAHNTHLGVIASLVGSLMRKKVVIKIPRDEYVEDLTGGSIFRQFRQWLLTRKTDRFIAITTEIVQALLKTGIPPQKISSISNGIEAPAGNGHSNRAALKVELIGNSEIPVVLFVGRLVAEKGLEQLLTVWASMPCRDRALLLIVGDGPLRKDLEAKARALQIFPSVLFFGHQLDVSKFYVVADLFVLPSKIEGMSNALLEAMSAGVPVVASDVGGNRDVIEHQQSGFLLDWEDVTGCVTVLTSLLSDCDLRMRLGKAAKRRVQSFAMGEVAERYHRLYKALLTE
jgi:glycosyltransferase involved in cell wall biosynthesis